jgi:hypothetical protein
LDLHIDDVHKDNFSIFAAGIMTALEYREAEELMGRDPQSPGDGAAQGLLGARLGGIAVRQG